MEKKRIQLLEITIEELVAILRKELMGVDQDKVMSRKEASEYLQVSGNTIWNWSQTGVLKSHKVGGKLYYRKSELDDLLESE